MAELKCPHCGQAFTVDDAELGSIIKQIRDKEFEKEISDRLSEVKEHLSKEHKLELEAKEQTIKLETKESYEDEIERLKKENQQLSEKVLKAQQGLDIAKEKEEAAIVVAVKKIEDEMNKQIFALNNQVISYKSEIENSKQEKKLAVIEAEKKAEEEKHELESKYLKEKQEMEGELYKEREKLLQEKEKSKVLLQEKDEQIAHYKDFKAKLSTKMVGESLERYCEDQFNALRATAFRNAYFEKDNDARTGSKGDFIFKENDENGVEIISIMFEMKNENDETATKHKNEDFFKELDKDRNEKGCEYAVLVSMLESDSELYNAGIVDVSYKYDKMYVVRPQCFIPIITLLRNAASNALSYKQELQVVKNQNIDISNFEDNLLKFKDDFSRNYDIAHKHFDKAIDEIDKTIDHLQKVKKELQGSDNQLRIANNKVDEVSIKRLTKNNPTMQAKFDELKK